MSKQITKSIRLTEREARELAELVAEHAASESALMRQWVLRGMQDYRIERAVAAYQRDEVDLSGGAAMAGIPIGSFVDELAMRRVAILHDGTSVKEELEEILAEFDLPPDLLHDTMPEG
jgi:predicted HTH domain antitoxin